MLKTIDLCWAVVNNNTMRTRPKQTDEVICPHVEYAGNTVAPHKFVKVSIDRA